MASFYNHFRGPRLGGEDRIPLSWVMPLLHGVVTGVFTGSQALTLLNQRLQDDNKAVLTAEAQAELTEVVVNINAASGAPAKLAVFHQFQQAGTLVENGFVEAAISAGDATLFDIDKWRTWAGVTDQSGA